jgi:hypothetical protein
MAGKSFLCCLSVGRLKTKIELRSIPLGEEKKVTSQEGQTLKTNRILFFVSWSRSRRNFTPAGCSLTSKSRLHHGVRASLFLHYVAVVRKI